MNRMILTFGGVLSATSLLILHSAIKGTVLLALAAMAALMLRRDSAATRHLVWMMAIAALLIVPILSATLWGISRCRLMLPAAARQWSDEQLQSVLMHELAFIKRGDILVQLLTQVACALHWFNPLVWFAAWRLDVERERSCDDLVLASGVRPSAYAAHLLDVVSGLSPANWIQACGLAMARKSTLEGRLTAVLGENLNRRSVSATLAVVAILIAVGIAVQRRS